MGKFCMNCGTQLPDVAEFCPKCGAHAALVPACQETPADPATPPSVSKPVAKRPVQGVVFAVVAAVIALITCVVLFALRQNKDARTAGETDPAQTKSLSTVSPSPSPSPSLSPMERKYSDFDPQATQLEFNFLGIEGVALNRETAEDKLAEYLYRTWYWEGTDTPFTIDETTIDGRTYYVHAVKEVPYEGIAARITYADDPEMDYRLTTYPCSTDPYIRMVMIESLNEGPDGYLYVGYEYSQSEQEQLYAEAEEANAEPEPTPPPANEYFYTNWYTVTIPGNWKDKYVWEENYGGYGDSFVHAVTFYSREVYESGDGGMLFSITLMNDIDREYEDYMEDSYTLGTLSDVSMMDEGRPSYYFADVVITTPSDGYDYAGTHPEYRELYNGIDAVVNSLTPADGYALF